MRVCNALCITALVGALYLLTPPPPVRAGSATIFIHGWDTDSVAHLWTAASQAAVDPAGHHGTITVTGSSGALVATASPWDVDLATATTNDIAVRVDWSAVANHLLSRVPAQAVAAAVAPLIHQGQNGTPPLCELPVHLVGHSRGGGMVCEIARLLGERGIEVDHLTLLDPHPLTSADPQLLLLSHIVDTPVAVYENVLFADNYWQSISYPAGEEVGGAYSRLWTSLPGGYHDSANALYRPLADHLNIHLLYLATIDLAPSATDGMASVSAAERTAWFSQYEAEGGVGGAKAGFWYSRSREPGQRLTDDTPVSGGDRVREGYNGEELLGGLGARQALGWSEAVWPNLLTLEVSLGGQPLDGAENTLAIGDTVSLRYTYRDYDSGCAVSVHLDEDRNPYNDNDLADFATNDHDAPTGAAIAESTVEAPVTALTPGGPTYLYATITDGVRTRHLYAAPALVASGHTGSAAEAADFDGSGQVGFDDFFLFADHFGLAGGDLGYDPLYDLDGSGDVGFDDFFLFADVFGTSY